MWQIKSITILCIAQKFSEEDTVKCPAEKWWQVKMAVVHIMETLSVIMNSDCTITMLQLVLTLPHAFRLASNTLQYKIHWSSLASSDLNRGSTEFISDGFVML